MPIALPLTPVVILQAKNSINLPYSAINGGNCHKLTSDFTNILLLQAKLVFKDQQEVFFCCIFAEKYRTLM